MTRTFKLFRRNQPSRTSVQPLAPQSKSSTPRFIAALMPFALAGPAHAAQTIMEEVVVTAQKREQTMQDVSLAVSAFNGDAIKQMGFEEGLDITLQVPNMSYFAIFGEASSPSISLRGLSLVNFSDSWESPVSIYVDDVYRGNPARPFNFLTWNGWRFCAGLKAHSTAVTPPAAWCTIFPKNRRTRRKPRSI